MLELFNPSYLYDIQLSQKLRYRVRKGTHMFGASAVNKIPYLKMSVSQVCISRIPASKMKPFHQNRIINF